MIPDGESSFFVREKVFSLIEKRIEALEKGFRQNIALIGLPGYGKSHLLGRVYDCIAVHPKFIPIFIQAEADDFEQLADRWMGGLLSGYLTHQGLPISESFQALLLSADPWIPKTTERLRAIKKAMRREKAGFLLKELFSLTETLHQETGKKVILLLDEFDRLELLAAGDPFGILSREIMIQKNTFFLAASSCPSRAKTILREKLSMLFGNFEVIPFSPLSFFETRKFLKAAALPWKWSVPQKNFLIHLTDGIPAYLELIVDRLKAYWLTPAHLENSFFQNADQIPDAFLLEALTQELLPKGRIAAMFEDLLQRCRAIRKDYGGYFKALLAVSQGRRKVKTIAAASDKKIMETKKILQRLCEEDILLRCGDSYILKDPLLAFWMREVYERRAHRYVPSQQPWKEEVYLSLQKTFQKFSGLETASEGGRLEALLSGFHNEVLDIDGKKIVCPQFHEILLRVQPPYSFILSAKNAKNRWVCLIASEPAGEEDVLGFLEEMKKYRKKPQRCLIALRGLDQKAKLIAQQAGVQVWDLRLVNKLLEIYDLPKIIPLEKNLTHEPDLGALAQSVYTA